MDSAVGELVGGSRVGVIGGLVGSLDMECVRLSGRLMSRLDGVECRVSEIEMGSRSVALEFGIKGFFLRRVRECCGGEGALKLGES